LNHKLTVPILIAIGSLLFAGCNPPSEPVKGEVGAKQGSDVTIGVVFDSGGRGDKSFNDSAYAGLERAKAEFGVQEKTIDSKSPKDFEGNLSAMAESGCKVVVAVGLMQKQALEVVAPKFPEVKFALIDEAVDAPNVRSLKFKEEEGSFLAGYLAALVSKTGKLGFVGGMDIPLIRKFQAGYEAGAKVARADIVVLPPKFTGGWDDAGLGKEAAKVLIGQGADVVYQAAGRGGLGVIDAAKEKGVYAIGVDSDQDYVAEGTVLTSMVKRVDEAVYSTIKDFLADKFTAGEVIYDLKAGGVGLSEMKFTKAKISPDILAKVDAAAEKIKSGEWTVPTSPSEVASFVSSAK
jgi:basic membrane protein A